MRVGLFATIVLALLLPVAALAQSLGDFATAASSFTVSIDPQYPAPYGTATLSFLSSSLDLTNATLAVSANGKSIYRGSVQPVAVALGRAGSATTVLASVTSGGDSFSQTLSIRPQDVALIAEPVSSAPLLYRGKSSIPLDGNVRVVAVANLKSASGSALNPNSLSYAWTVDGAEIANVSGIGKSAIMVASPLQYRARDVSVTVMSTDGRYVGGASLSLTAREPSVRLYENDPLLGIRFDRALSGAYSITGAESAFYAAAFSLPTTQGTPLFQWFLDGGAVQTGNAITLRPSGSGQGRALLSLVVSSGDYAKATAALSLSFGEATGFNFFGL